MLDFRNKYIIFTFMALTESQKKELMIKYSGQTSDQILTYLKRNFPTHEIKHDWMSEPTIFIQIGDKTRLLQGNKKYLVNKIYDIIRESFMGEDEKIIRRTIKKYLDGIK